MIKLSKLSIATKIYRGIIGGVLPKEFWIPNQQGVKGGIECATPRRLAARTTPRPSHLRIRRMRTLIERAC